MGEFWDRDQVPAAIELIETAKRGAQAPVVMVFIHGWKNNADERTGRQNQNIVGFEAVLEYAQRAIYPGHPVVGVFVGWRGDLISKYWPVRRQFSYFNRERTAIRTPGPSMTSALTQVMRSAHRDRAGLLVMIGHSFGGLILERALEQAMTDSVLRHDAASSDPRSDGAWADLVVYLNSAAAATEGKQMLDLLKQYRYSIGQTNRPLLLSISSLGDAATRFAMPVGHAPAYSNYQANGSWRQYDTPDPPGVKKQSDYFMSTTAHMPALQSHLIVSIDDVKQCADSSGRTAMYGPPFQLPNGLTYQICEKPGRWNDSPYWAMQMPATIVPDHNGIFNENFVGLLTKFLPDVVEVDDLSSRPSLRKKP